jgi:hypothetical protein
MTLNWALETGIMAIGDGAIDWFGFGSVVVGEEERLAAGQSSQTRKKG